LDAIDKLGEDDRLFGQGQVGLSSVVGVVQTNGDELAHLGHGAAHAGLAFDQRQAVGFELAQLGQGLVVELIGGDVFDDLAQVTQLALCINEARFFLAGFTVANEFHGLPF